MAIYDDPAIYDDYVPLNRLGEFLRAHREAAPAHSGAARRRTPGLRREEVAEAATISVDYYTRLEQGRERHPSVSVLDGLTTALALSPAEAEYMRALAVPGAAAEYTDTAINEFLVLAMQAWDHGPAYIVNHRSDVLAVNELARDMLGQFEISDNIVRMLFLDPLATRLWRDWESFATYFLGGIRRMMGTAIDDDPATVALIADVSARNPTFTAIWDRQAISVPERKAKTFRDAERGDLELEYEFELLKAFDTPNQVLVVHRMRQ